MPDILFLVLLSISVIVLVFIRLNRASIRGRRGEKRISSILSSLPERYILYNDVYLEMKGRSVQIDHVIISRYGVFVIETKNYTGWIYGTDQSEYWTKNMYGNRYQFRNPLKQNYSHVKSLQLLLRIPESRFIPIVVFLNGATLKCDTTGNVIYPDQLKQTILGYSTIVFSENEVEGISTALSEACIMKKNRKREHIHKVKKDVDKKYALIASGICPRCKGKLILRKGRYGEFWGCSNYPQCNFKYK